MAQSNGKSIPTSCGPKRTQEQLQARLFLSILFIFKTLYMYIPKGKVRSTHTVKGGRYSLTLTVMDSLKANIDNERFRRDPNSESFRPLYLVIVKNGKGYKIDEEEYSDITFFKSPSGKDYWSNTFYIDGGVDKGVKKIEFVRKSGKIDVMTRGKADRGITEHNAALDSKIRNESVDVNEKDPIVHIIYH